MPTLKSWSLLVLLRLLADAQGSSAAPPLDPNSTVPACSCYQPTDSDGALFLNHQFFDFRAPPNGSFAQNLTAPDLINDDQDEGIEDITSPFFGRGFFGDYFVPASWTKNASDVAPILMVNSQQNIYLTRDTPDSPVHLTLRSNRLSTFQSASDLETVETALLHASIRIRARVAGSPGACAGMFTYYSDDQESDIEILTRDEHNVMRATNQPGVDSRGIVIPEASTQVTFSPANSNTDGSWADWNEYQLDWLPGRSEWFINGVSKLNKTYGVPTEPSNFQIKMWSDGSAWTGNMSVGGLATLDIEWIDMVYNTTHDTPGESCKTVCTVENIENNPVPQVAGATIRATMMGMSWALVLGTFWAGVAFLC